MQKLIVGLSVIVAFLVIQTPPLAVASDKFTPAEETICDPLKHDGVTKGLYGLCVAFCEAQDFSSNDDEIAPWEMDQLESNAPSGRILAQYNKKKQKSDPDMPCIFKGPCPCFSKKEIDEIDGYMEGVDYGCTMGILGSPDGSTYGKGESCGSSGARWVLIRTYSEEEQEIYQCTYGNEQGIPDIHRNLSSETGTLTEKEYKACFKIIWE